MQIIKILHESRWEVRCSEAEVQKKPEGRNPNAQPDQALFGFRTSVFFRVSGLGLRISSPPSLPAS